MVWLNHILFIHSPTDERLCCFYFWAVMNAAAINVHIQGLCAQRFGSLEDSELLGHIVTVFNILRQHQTVFLNRPTIL